MLFANTTPYTAPCKDCTDRKLNCHCVCNKYLEYRALVDKYYETQKGERDFKQYATERTSKNVAKALKHRKHFRT